MELEENIKKLLIKEWFDKEDVRFLDDAVSRIEKRHDGVLGRLMVNHGKVLDTDKLFNSIGKMIKFLTSLKEEGYESISEEWSGYESNYFIANKHELETDEEYASRVYGVINREINCIKDEAEEKEKKLKEIERLESEIRKLKQGL